MARTLRDTHSDLGGRFLPAIVVVAALVALAGLMSVRADGPADAFMQGGSADIQ